MEFILKVGVDRISRQVRALGDQIASGAARKGYEVLGNRTPETGAGIVSIRKDGIDSRLIVRSLKEQGIIAAPRQGWVRMSPHFYITQDEIARVLELLP